MARILTTDIALPEHKALQDEVSAAMARWLTPRVSQLSKVTGIFSRSGVTSRYSVVPLEELFTPRSFEERNRAYAEYSISLSLEAARRVLESSGLPPAGIGLVTTVSCTGFMIPSVDAHLANLLPLSPHVRRLPITELGCAAGAMALSRTAEYLTARPRESALVISVELPSLNFQPGDVSMAHLVSCALFGDGAAATLMVGEEAGRISGHARAPRIAASRTRFFHDTLEYMGFQLRDSGFHMLLDARIPDLVDAEVGPAMGDFLASLRLDVDDIQHFLIHPGGRRIIDSVERLVGRGPEALRHSRRVLDEYGNLSSGSVLYLLREFERSEAAAPGDRGLLMAFGPGFNVEMVLLEWPG